MSNLDPRIELIRAEYKLDRSAFWELPQKKGTWLVKHSALEIVAATAGIVFEQPMILEANSAEGIAAVCVTGHLGDRAVWSIGEASAKNSKNQYPWAMAEKRALDRVILKLIGIHGLVYSEDEMNDAEPAPRVLVKDQREIDGELRAEILACPTEEDLLGLWRSPQFQAEFAKLNKGWQDSILELMGELRADRKAAPAVPPRGYVEPVFPPQ